MDKAAYKTMRQFYNLGVKEVAVIDYLMENISFCDTWTSLAKNLGMETTNLCKAIRRLSKLQIVCVEKQTI